MTNLSVYLHRIRHSQNYLAKFFPLTEICLAKKEGDYSSRTGTFAAQRSQLCQPGSKQSQPQTDSHYLISSWRREMSESNSTELKSNVNEKEKKSPFWKITIQIMAHNKNINFTFSRTEARSAWEISNQIRILNLCKTRTALHASCWHVIIFKQHNLNFNVKFSSRCWCRFNEQYDSGAAYAFGRSQTLFTFETSECTKKFSEY